VVLAVVVAVLQVGQAAVELATLQPHLQRREQTVVKAPGRGLVGVVVVVVLQVLVVHQQQVQVQTVAQEPQAQLLV
jgi:hypothetical protein